MHDDVLPARRLRSLPQKYAGLLPLLLKVLCTVGNSSSWSVHSHLLSLEVAITFTVAKTLLMSRSSVIRWFGS